MNREQLEKQWREVAAELAEIARHRIVPERLAVGDREGELLEEQDAIEYELGLLYLEWR